MKNDYPRYAIETPEIIPRTAAEIEEVMRK